MQSFNPSQMTYDADEPAVGLIGLISGQVQLLLGRGNQIHALAHLAQPGDWFGGEVVLSGTGRTVRLQAKSAVSVAHLSQRSIETIVQAAPPPAWRWIGMLSASNISAAMMTNEYFKSREPHKRCVAVLLRLAHCRSK
ncbi:MAG: cyclic nucleotide-binding domain-containing protein [Sedimentitalea sp.]|uniref:cyclic nucleotide-binding domain-containing protein n=1 Tax=Sedimentitalea sp. TaxID=2048915 RepID=UPI0032677CF4